MSSKRLYFVLLASIGLLIIGLLGGAYGVNSLLSRQADDLKNDRLQVAVLSQQQDDLNKAKQDVQKYQSLADITKSVVPQDKDQAQTVRQIVDIASANQVPLVSISFPTSTLGANAIGVQLSQLTPVVGIPGVYSLNISVQSDPTHPIPYTQFLSFLAGLEQNRRTALVNAITIAPSSTDRSKLSFSLVLEESIKP